MILYQIFWVRLTVLWNLTPRMNLIVINLVQSLESMQLVLPNLNYAFPYNQVLLNVHRLVKYVTDLRLNHLPKLSY